MSCGQRFVLGDLRLVVGAVFRRRLIQYVFRVVSSPGMEIC